jgi:hypothetical protein
MPTAAHTVLLFLLGLSTVAADAATGAPAPAPVPVTGPGVTGTVLRYPAFHSTHVAARNVDV